MATAPTGRTAQAHAAPEAMPSREPIPPLEAGDLLSPAEAVDVEGLLRSTVFPGLWLDPAALLGGDLARVLAVAQMGLASLEHGQFVERLTAVKPPTT